jgi:hypothetical protein
MPHITVPISSCSATSLISDTTSASSDPGKVSRTAELKRTRFNAKYKGHTDAEILRMYNTFFILLMLMASLVAQQKGWRSNVYEHFHAPVIVRADGKVKYKFICKR